MPTMNAVSAAEMAAIRQEVASAALDLPCVINRKVITRDAFGTETEAWSVFATVMSGVQSPSVGHLTNYAYIIGNLATWLVLVPYDTDIRIQDQLLIDGDTMVVQVVLTPQSFSAVQAVLASEVKQI